VVALKIEIESRHANTIIFSVVNSWNVEKAGKPRG